MAWDDLDNNDLGPDKIVTTGTMNALYNNPIAMAQRDVDAPLVQALVCVYLTANTVWPIPDGVTAWEEELIGAGGSATVGGGSTTTYNGLTVTAGGGGLKANGADAVVLGGAAVNGDLNVTGGYGITGVSNPGGVDHLCAQGGNGPFGLGQGGFVFVSGATPPVVFNPGSGYGSGRSGAGGGAGARKRRVRVSGLDAVTVVVGVAGAGAGAGVVIIRY